MIGKFWECLFSYADKMKAENRLIELNVVRRIEQMLLEAYDAGLANAVVIKDKKPKNKLEELVLSIPDIVVYYDKNDHSYMYELDAYCDDGNMHDGHHFDTPEEVIQYLIKVRNVERKHAIGQAKADVYKYIARQIRSIKSNDINDDKPKNIMDIADKKDGDDSE